MKVILIDGKNAIFRHHFVNTKLTAEDGHPTGAIFGCLNSMLGIASRLPDAAIVWIWDGEGETWRHTYMKNLPSFEKVKPIVEEDEDDMFSGFQKNMVSSSMNFFGFDSSVLSVPKTTKEVKPKKVGYKANRKKPELKELKAKRKYPIDEKARALIQIPILRMILEGIGIKNLQVRGLEGDDLVAIVAKKIIKMDDNEVIIHSGDRDYYQLLKYDRIKIMTRLSEGKLQWVHPEDVLEQHGVSVHDWVKYRAWTGDKSDNIPHVHKVGPKTALRMLEDGLDPSLSSCKGIPSEVKEKYARYFGEVGIDSMWPAVYGNYKVTKLVTNPESKMLPDSVKLELHRTLRKFKSVDDFCRDKAKQNAITFRKIGYLMAQYNLASIIGRRNELMQIP